MTFSGKWWNFCACLLNWEKKALLYNSSNDLQSSSEAIAKRLSTRGFLQQLPQRKPQDLQLHAKFEFHQLRQIRNFLDMLSFLESECSEGKEHRIQEISFEV